MSRGAADILEGIDEGGWSALEYADRVLSKHSSEVTIADGMRRFYLDQVRALIDEIAGDPSLSAEDCLRIVDLLGKVGDALLDVEINGTLPVQEAVAAAGAIVRLSL
jgi:hypothetical protein